MRLKKLGIALTILCLGLLPSFVQAFEFANANSMTGRVSKGHFFDSETTLMSEVDSEKKIIADEYWTKNTLRFNKYRPLFMLSNKELYNLMPRERISVSQRISTPSIYNISLRSASITSVSLKTQKPILTQKPITEEPKKTSQTQQAPSLTAQYKQAKSETQDMDKKIEVAVLLKNSKKASDYTLAFDLLNEVTAKEPLNAYAYYLKAEIFAQKNDAQNAIKNYAEALRINPMSKQSCLGLAKVLEPTNKSLARKYYELAKNN